MTFGIGAHCSDGIVIAADSLALRAQGSWKTGSLSWQLEKKLHRLGESIVFVPSGGFRLTDDGGVWAPRADRCLIDFTLDYIGQDLDMAVTSFEDAAAHVFAQLQAATNPDGPDDGAFGMLFGGLDRGVPALKYLRQDTVGPSIERTEPGQILGSGAMIGPRKTDYPTDIGLGQAGADLTVDLAESIVLGIAAVFVRTRYRGWGFDRFDDFVPAGVPPYGFPLQVAVITAAGTRTTNYAEPSLETSARMMAAMHIEMPPLGAIGPDGKAVTATALPT